MRVTVLGKSPSWQDAGGACSGYLVEHGATRLLLDCGNGVFGKLRAARDYASVDAVLISHLHADHLLDLVPFAYALTHSPRAGTLVRPPLPAPPGAREVLRRVAGAWGAEDLVEEAFVLREHDGIGPLEIGEMTVGLAEVVHFVRSFAVGAPVSEVALTATAVAVSPSSITATVAALLPGGGVPTGDVAFSVDGSQVGSAPLSGGAAVLAYSVASGSGHTVSAVYGGSTDYAGSSTSTTRNDPSITAAVTSSQPRNAAGWYRVPVLVTFTCTTHGSPLASRSPAPSRRPTAVSPRRW